MNEEINGQVCEMCKMFIAKPERYAGTTWLCDVCTPAKKHKTVTIKSKTSKGIEYTSTRPCQCAECRPDVKLPPKGTVCCLESCEKESTILSPWGAPYCRTCMMAVDHTIDLARETAYLNRSNGLNPDGSMTRIVDNAGNPRYGTEQEKSHLP